MSARSRELVTEVVIASRPLGDIAVREAAVEHVLDAIALERIGVASLAEFADRLAWQSAALVMDHREVEARMMAAAARVIAA